MQIAIFTFGSRGDVQPYLALAVGLQAAGHRVTLVAPHTTAEQIRSYGVQAHPWRFDLDEFFRLPASQALIQSGNVVRQMRALTTAMRAGLMAALDDFWEAAQTADFVVQSFSAPGGVEAAGRRGVPLAFAFLQPLTPTRAFPSFFLPVRWSLGGGYNLMTHRLVLSVFGAT